MSRLRMLLAGLLLPAGLAAQAPVHPLPDRERDGPYAFAGAGGTGVSESCHSCFSTSGSGIGLVAGFGWVLTHRFAVEASAEGTQRTFDQTLEKSVHLLAGVRVQVAPRLSVRAAGGLAHVRREQRSGATSYHYEHDGTGWAVGAEYGLPLSSQTVLSPYVTFRGMSTGDLKRGGVPFVPEHTFSVIEVGVNLRWHLRDLILPEAKHRGPEEAPRR